MNQAKFSLKGGDRMSLLPPPVTIASGPITVTGFQAGTVVLVVAVNQTSGNLSAFRVDATSNPPTIAPAPPSSPTQAAIPSQKPSQPPPPPAGPPIQVHLFQLGKNQVLGIAVDQVSQKLSAYKVDGTATPPTINAMTGTVTNLTAVVIP